MAVKRDLLVDKLLDKKFFNTVYISKADEEKATAEHVELLVELLCDPRHKPARQEIFNFLKKEPKAVELLVRGILSNPKDKKTLIVAVWESNLDASPYVGIFTEIVIRDEFEVAMEALTVIEQMTGEVPAQKATELLKHVQENYAAQANTPKSALLLDLVDLLNRWV